MTYHSKKFLTLISLGLGALLVIAIFYPKRPIPLEDSHIAGELMETGILSVTTVPCDVGVGPPPQLCSYIVNSRDSAGTASR